MPTINIPIDEIKILSTETHESALQIDYTYYPALPMDPLGNVSREADSVKINHVYNEFGEDILDKNNKKVLTLLSGICKKDAEMALSGISGYIKSGEIRDYQTAIRIKLD